MIEARWQRILPVALFAAAALAAVAPIRNYDFFWHLATGRWIVDNHALPLSDPFTLASDRVPWINGEWLFEVLLYGAHEAIGVSGMSWLRGALAALVFGIAYAFSKRESEPHVALLLAALAYCGAMPTFDLRPSSVSMLLLVIALGTTSTPSHFFNSLLWINVHPSAVLAPVVATLRTRRFGPVIASALALLLNPFGYRAILAPIELTLFARSGQFVNAEWLPSSMSIFPMLYVCIALAAVAFATAGERRPHWWRVVLLVLFAYLAVRHVRNQGLFFASFPILVAPMVRRQRVAHAIAYAAAAMGVAYVAFTTDHRMGVAPERFPLQAIARLEDADLTGNIYNPDQFGGVLIWSFYPQRRALTDGRNELYHAYIPEYARARGDERAWRAFLAKYQIDVAVEEYLPPLQVMDAQTRRTRSMAASLAYWPRERWALIAYDRAAMVFARRAAFLPEVLQKWEIRDVPDVPRYESSH